MAIAQIFTASNSKISLSFRDTKFTMLGFESFSYTDNLVNEMSYDPTRNTNGASNLQGGIEADTLSITCTVEDSALINLINELFATRELGTIIITHKEDPNRILSMSAIVAQRAIQVNADDSNRSKLVFNFKGKTLTNSY
ncbi:MAG: hypothetical protein FWE18_00175 [Alphaproteobacteria bacterium]|nr:hypothetical protein [Alphaproteobacteria bacterium]